MVAPDLRVSWYPNPTNNLVYYEITGASDSFVILVHSTEGRLVDVREVHGHERQTGCFDLTGLPSGTYYLRISTGHEEVVRKLVVVR
ncbi:MAG: T9SS type A sorting domain-containing protein [Bacteroidetes bacterium]|nr:T9SS type A sorting domain-containing protein [Bacteroidota bacterium]